MTTNNHPAHGPVSLDRLHQIREILSKAAAQSDGGNLGYAMADAVKVIDVAIAAFSAEPLAWIVHARTGDQLTTDGNYVANAEGILGLHSTPLYTAKPAPVVPDDLLSMAASAIEDILEHTDPSTNYYSGVWADVPGKLRAAMLQWAEPVSEHDELPLDYLQGHKDGLEWAAQLAKANHPETGDWLYDDPIELSKAIRKGPDMPLSDGNSPVTPDTWIPVSERMPERDVDVQVYCADKKEQMVGYMERNETEGWFRFASLPNGAGVYCKPTHWMPLPAAPQQEVKS